MSRFWPHWLLGHHWRYRGLRVCPGCQRMHRVYTCRCGRIREQQ